MTRLNSCLENEDHYIWRGDSDAAECELVITDVLAIIRVFLSLCSNYLCWQIVLVSQNLAHFIIKSNKMCNPVALTQSVINHYLYFHHAKLH
jgi:hypothetical protein